MCVYECLSVSGYVLMCMCMLETVVVFALKVDRYVCEHVCAFVRARACV